MTTAFAVSSDPSSDPNAYRTGPLSEDIRQKVEVVAQSLSDTEDVDTCRYRLAELPPDLQQHVQVVESPAPAASAPVTVTTAAATKANPARAQAVEAAASTPVPSLKEADYKEQIGGIDPERPDGLAPTATLDNAALYRIIREVAVGHSGDVAYTALSKDAEFGQSGQPAYQKRHFGLAFGLLLFTQESGHLGSVLKLMQKRDPAAFATSFGPKCDVLIEVTNASQPEERLRAVDGELLWSDVWAARFQEAGANPTFQVAQNEEAIEGLFRPMLNIVFGLGMISDRGLAMALDRVVTRGVGGGLEWVVQAAGPLRTTQQRATALGLLGYENLRAFQSDVGWTPQDGNFGPETHAAMVGALREQGQIPLPTPNDYVSRMVSAATESARLRLLRLRDSTVLTDMIYQL